MSNLSTRDFIKEILNEDYNSEDIKKILLNLLDYNRLKDCSVIKPKSKDTCVFSGHIEISFDDNKEALLFLKIVKHLNKSGKNQLSIINPNIIDIEYKLKEDGKTVSMKTIDSQYVNSIDQGLKEVKNMYSDVVSRTVKRLINLNLITNKQETSLAYRNLLLNSGLDMNEQDLDKLTKIFAINNAEFIEKMNKIVFRAENGHHINGQNAAEIENWLKKIDLNVLMDERRDDLLELISKNTISQSVTKENSWFSEISDKLKNVFNFEKPNQNKIEKIETTKIKINRTIYA